MELCYKVAKVVILLDLAERISLVDKVKFGADGVKSSITYCGYPFDPLTVRQRYKRVLFQMESPFRVIL